MKRARSEIEENNDKENNHFQRSGQSVETSREIMVKANIDILSFPNDILIKILVILSCCEYNILKLVSIKFNRLILEFVPKIDKKITIELSFAKALTNIATNSIVFGHFTLADWCHEIKYQYDVYDISNSESSSNLMYTSALSRHDQDGINWLVKNHYVIDTSICCDNLWYTAIKGGLSNLTWLSNEIELPSIGRIDFWNQMMYRIGKSGNVQMFQLMIKSKKTKSGSFTNMEDSSYMLIGGLEEKHYHIIEWLNKNDMSVISLTCLQILIFNGLIEPFNWLYDNGFILKNNNEFYFNSVKIQFLGGPISFRDCYYYAINDHQKDFVNLFYNKFKISLCHHLPITSVSNIIDIKWIHEQGMFPCNDCKNGKTQGCITGGKQLCSYLVGIGNFEGLKWARNVAGCEWDRNTCIMAARNGFFDILKWVLEQGCPYNKIV